MWHAIILSCRKFYRQMSRNLAQHNPIYHRSTVRWKTYSSFSKTSGINAIKYFCCSWLICTFWPNFAWVVGPADLYVEASYLSSRYFSASISSSHLLTNHLLKLRKVWTFFACKVEHFRPIAMQDICLMYGSICFVNKLISWSKKGFMALCVTVWRTAWSHADTRIWWSRWSKVRATCLRPRAPSPSPSLCSFQILDWKSPSSSLSTILVTSSALLAAPWAYFSAGQSWTSCIGRRKIFTNLQLGLAKSSKWLRAIFKTSWPTYLCANEADLIRIQLHSLFLIRP